MMLHPSARSKIDRRSFRTKFNDANVKNEGKSDRRQPTMQVYKVYWTIDVILEVFILLPALILMYVTMLVMVRLMYLSQ